MLVTKIQMSLRNIDDDASNAGPSQMRARILLADDNADMRNYVRRLLLPYHDVNAVADGEAALAAIAHNKRR